MTSTEIQGIIIVIILFCLFLLWFDNVRLERRVEGERIDKAKRMIEEYGYECRIVEEDGREYSHSSKPSYNLYIRGGKVYRCEYK